MPTLPGAASPHAAAADNITQGVFTIAAQAQYKTNNTLRNTNRGKDKVCVIVGRQMLTVPNTSKHSLLQEQRSYWSVVLRTITAPAAALYVAGCTTWHCVAPRCQWRTAGCRSCWWWRCCAQPQLSPLLQQRRRGACWGWCGRAQQWRPSGAAPAHLRWPAGGGSAPAQPPRPAQPCGPLPPRRPAQQRRQSWPAAWRTARRSAPPARG